MKGRLGLLLAVVTLHVISANESIAYQLMPTDLAEKVTRAAAVARVNIVEGIEVRISDVDGTSVICGFDYRARVVEPFEKSMGVGQEVRFRSMDELRVGGDHLVLFGIHYLDAALSFTSMGRDRPDLLERCREGAPKLFASIFHGQIFEFYVLAQALMGSEWIEVSSDATRLPENAEAREVTLRGVDSPIYRIVKWADVRAAILKALADAKRKDEVHSPRGFVADPMK